MIAPGRNSNHLDNLDLSLSGDCEEMVDRDSAAEEASAGEELEKEEESESGARCLR